MPAPSPRTPLPKPSPRYVRSPVVILPPAQPGEPTRRIALKPSRVFLLLGLIFVLGGAAVGVGLGWMVREVQIDNQRLATEMAALKAEVAALREPKDKGPELAPEPVPAPDPTTFQSGTPRRFLDIRTALLRAPEPKVRIAVSIGSRPVTLKGEGLHFVHKNGRTTPMPGRAVIKLANGGVFAEGIGNLKAGTAIETRLGPIRIGKQEYPDRMEIFREDKKILLVSEVEMEDYVASVVSSELPASWGLEAKKAQAVVARSYTYMRRSTSTKAYHLDGTVADQVYKGSSTDASSRAAVTATQGQVLSLGGKLVSTFYSSTCAGTTEEPNNVWPGRPSHGVSSVTCGYCANSRSLKWSTHISDKDLLGAARRSGHKAKSIDELVVAETHDSGRISSVELKTNRGGVLWSANEFRELLGWDQVRSTLFKLKRRKTGYDISGKGFGHGVGLCQWGAQGMDRKGMDYKEILTHYYPRTQLDALY
jgi:stage II sporulation protein D